MKMNKNFFLNLKFNENKLNLWFVWNRFNKEGNENDFEGVEERRRGRRRRPAFSVWVRACGQIRPPWASGCRPRLRSSVICRSLLAGRRRLRRNRQRRWFASGRFYRLRSAAYRRAVSSSTAAPAAPASLTSSSRWYLKKKKTDS